MVNLPDVPCDSATATSNSGQRRLDGGFVFGHGMLGQESIGDGESKQEIFVAGNIPSMPRVQTMCLEMWRERTGPLGESPSHLR